MSESSSLLDLELRKLRPAELYTLGQILNVSDSWKKLMAIVPKENVSNLPKFNAEHFDMIEQAAQQQRRNAAEIFLSEWGTMGKDRPTLRILLNLLVKAELFRAADYVAGDILKGELPKRPKYGPAAPVDVSDEVIRKLLEEKEEFETLGFNESLIFALPSKIDDNQTVNPKQIDNETSSSSLERNMQSTKLVSAKGREDKYLEKLEQMSNVPFSDLMKFSSEQNIDDCVNQVFKQQEVSSHELPIFLNEFGQSIEQMKSNSELLSEDLPVFLNNNGTLINSTLSRNQLNISMHLSNLNINQNELSSSELPQCVADLGVKNKIKSTPNLDRNHNTENYNISKNVLASQDLPMTVLEYNT